MTKDAVNLLQAMREYLEHQMLVESDPNKLELEQYWLTLIDGIREGHHDKVYPWVTSENFLMIASVIHRSMKALFPDYEYEIS